jgi:hypothetical protein
MRQILLFVLIAGLTGASILNAFSGAGFTDDRALNLVNIAESDSDCRVRFRFSNSKSYDIYIDWYNSYSRRKGIHTWRRLANLYVSTYPGERIPAGSRIEAVRTVPQICRSYRRYRLLLRTDKNGNGQSNDAFEDTTTVYLPCSSGWQCWHRRETQAVDGGDAGRNF